ncbi:MAG TPA: AraC family transcriptional regulator ligand-binding domain-containing protein [Kofleriaceae bacterium]|nr:AraC family transcriptional regulator ligand-binding domain-containing protein [Kofleriaceae bacterium]
MLRYVRERGGDAAALGRRHGLPADAATAPFLEIELARLHAVLDAAATAAADPLLGVHVGTNLPRETWDVLQMACTSSATLRGALANLPRLVSLFNDDVAITARGARAVTVEHAIAGEPDGLSRHGNELWVAALLARARQATNTPLRPAALWFAHRAPPARELAALIRALDVPAPSFGAGATGLELAAEDADRRLRTADPVLLGVLDRLLTPQLAALGDRRTLAAGVCRALDAALSAGALPSMHTVARGLGVSSRTLQRELAETGTSFRALVDHVRQTRARTLLHRDVPIDEVAAQLGYSERSAFVRAFGRWVGKS